MENRIKEQQLDLFATRTPARRMAVNQVRLWLPSLADTVFSEIRRFGLRGTNNARALCDTMFRIGAHVWTSVRRVAFSLSSSYPRKDLFVTVYDQLRRAGPLTA